MRTILLFIPVVFGFFLYLSLDKVGPVWYEIRKRIAPEEFDEKDKYVGP